MLWRLGLIEREAIWPERLTKMPSNDPQKDEIAKKHGKALAEETDLQEHEDRFVELFAEALSDYEAQRPKNAEVLGRAELAGAAITLVVKPAFEAGWIARSHDVDVVVDEAAMSEAFADYAKELLQ